MIIISHRGYWNEYCPKNSIKSFERSFELGFGTETDFRDHCGSLVISHDPPGMESLLADYMLRALAKKDPSLILAANIKADGLQNLIKQSFETHGIENYFLFDMSVPDAVMSLRVGLRVFTRQSDLEPEPNFYREAAGVWMDAFFDDKWLIPETIERHLDAGKQVCLVSPELHGRPHLNFWERLAASTIHSHPSLLLCSDIPEEAQSYFNL